MAVSVDMGDYHALVLKDYSWYKLLEINSQMPEHIAFILSKSGVDPCRDGRVSSVTRKECRQTDEQTAFQLYVVDTLRIMIIIIVFLTIE